MPGLWHSFSDAGSNPDRAFIFLNYLSHHVLTNYSIYVNRSYFECHLVVFEWHLKFLNVTFLTFIFEITYVPRLFRTHARGFAAS